ncbi:CDP-alcohol phosphatidyltransferase family protein [Candidatus Falkowbacteria bacterium]|jgi:CDP-diacylglycerol--glycerol-3-phosphate 3-phosphatidyltransferase|nr:CDP-alcohol phosphatidyltransferase family protein [Candidatus Falkowbacteria bacterium]MBT5502830.1 CDP-alcohol phosphatidyltransferase family protein [Candidatus Falkowbacteria bacterium]MBT6574290.1 CDP-alcohol phosphatidyltransferase family protein [Candidatus Falkowbacteria bacterium]MBT7348857.1 CDP-alcohol phosphatidyltransferase family protein [Candidatus Falkowbacteria bacterium]MBT7501008.1 CDP-alcohol phosphatidyltransferase family protein [Candidatus Falkowbacteria bacterium]
MENKEQIVFAPYDRILKYALPLVPKSVKPNHLTFIRLIFSPILIVLLVGDEFLIAIILFVILAITDMLDGTLARLRNQITDWGKIWDPIADKLLIGIVVATLLLQINLNLTILLLAFELAFILGGAFSRMKQIEVMANVWGKIKMNLQCFGAGFLMLGFMLNIGLLIFLAQVLLYTSIGFASLSMLKKGI